MTDRTKTHGADRRQFLGAGAALTAAGGLALPRMAAAANAQIGEVVAAESYARIETLAPNVWGVVSTPLKEGGGFHPETVCNGGLVAGDDRVVAIDAFLQPQGSIWLQKEAMRLTGRAVTDVVLTHFHPDHTGGIAGFLGGAQQPNIIATETTRKLMIERLSVPRGQEGADFLQTPVNPLVMPNRVIPDDAGETALDLGGGRTLTLEHLSGHTPSDLAIHVSDAPVTFAGDLVWQDFFHNYVDAIPTKLRASVGKLLKNRRQTIVTGHGSIGKARDMRDYMRLLDDVGEKATAAHAAGRPFEEAAKEYAIPEKLGAWTLFSPAYFETAYRAWYRELG